MSDTNPTNIKIPSDLKKKLKKMAIDEETSLSGLILKMINESIESRENKSKNEFEKED